MLDLPVSVLGTIFSVWLDVQSVTNYDEAQCNKSDRSAYLHVLRTGGLTLREVRICDDRGDFSVLDWICRRAVRVVKVDINCCGIGGDLACSFISTVGPGLKELTLDNICHISRSICQQVALSCTGLQLLRLSGDCCLRSEDLTGLLQSCASSLRSLALENSRSPPFEISTALPLLQRLRICTSCPDRQSIMGLVQNCPNLLEFAFHKECNVPGKLLALLSQCCPKLEVLRCGVGARHLLQFGEVLQRCTALHTVDLWTGDIEAATSGIADSVMATFLHCRNLRALRVKDLPSDAFPRLTEHAVALDHLFLVDEFLPDAASILILAERCGNLRSLALDIGSSDFPFNPVGSSERALRRLFRRLPLVEELDLSNARWLTDKFLLTIAHHCPRLRRISLKNTDITEAETITALVKHCPDLHVIHHASEEEFDIDYDSWNCATGSYSDPDDDDHAELWSEENKRAWRSIRPGLEFCDDISTKFGYWADAG